MVQSFSWRMNPDTLYFWLDTYCSQWDDFCIRYCQSYELIKRFKFVDDCDEEQVLNQITAPFACFSQNEPNRFREVVQVIDLVSMDLVH